MAEERKKKKKRKKQKKKKKKEDDGPAKPGLAHAAQGPGLHLN